VKAVLMPALGVAMTEGMVLRWLKQPGDSVVEGEPVLEIETDKSAVEVPSPASGILGPHLFPEGEMVPTGIAVTHVSDGSDDVVDSIAVVPPVTDGADVGVADTPVRPTVTPAASIAPAVRTPHLLSPRQRRLAREAITAETVPAPATPSTPASAPVAGAGTAGRYRSLIAAKVVESWTTMPHFSVSREVDASAMARVRAAYGGSDRPSYTDLMVRALALALRAGGATGPVDVGLAVATPNGVMIPVVRDVLGLYLGTLRREREAAVARAREDRLLPADLRDSPQTTLSNLGTLGVDSFTGVIAVGQMSLLTVGRIMPRPYVSGNGIAVRESFHATLNVDHRSLDGEDAARLLVAFVDAVEDVASLADGEIRR
jgi:pyruvate/2-oxoglutarate dehydrogenase complex dihydrolipoamide acyltransferase (E2) component